MIKLWGRGTEDEDEDEDEDLHDATASTPKAARRELVSIFDKVRKGPKVLNELSIRYTKIFEYWRVPLRPATIFLTSIHETS